MLNRLILIYLWLKYYRHRRDQRAPPDCRFVDFQSLTVDDVVAAIRALPDQ